MMFVCDVCGAIARDALSMAVHVARAHGQQALTWPDGEVVTWPNELEPEDFMEGTDDA